MSGDTLLDAAMPRWDCALIRRSWLAAIRRRAERSGTQGQSTA